MALLQSLLFAVFAAILVSSTLAAEPDFILHKFANSASYRTSKLANYDSYTNHQQHVACLKESQLSHCALTDSSGSPVVVQSDFACGEDNTHEGWQGFAPGSALSGYSVGNCVWNFNYYFSGPVQMQSGRDLYRIAGATATCQLTSDVGKCGGPECEALVLGLQGDLYITPAYSKQPGFFHNIGPDTLAGTDAGSTTPTCCILDALAAYSFIGIQTNNGQCNDCNTCFDVCNDCTNIGGGSFNDFCGSCCDDCNRRRIAPGSPRTDLTTPNTTRFTSNQQRFWQARKPKTPSTAKTATVQGYSGGGHKEYYGHQEPTTYYEGKAQFITGSAYIVTVKDSNEKVEEVGLFEYMFDWQTEGAAITGTPSGNYPWIEPGTFKFAWSEEKQEQQEPSYPA